MRKPFHYVKNRAQQLKLIKMGTFNIIYKPNGNHKSKPTNKYAKNKEKKSKYISKESQQNREREKDKKGSEKIFRNNHKTNNENKYISINNYLE